MPQHFHLSFLSILERKVLCRPKWKIYGFRIKVFFPLSQPNNIQTHFLSKIFHPSYFTTHVRLQLIPIMTHVKPNSFALGLLLLLLFFLLFLAHLDLIRIIVCFGHLLLLFYFLLFPTHLDLIRIIKIND